MLEFDIEKNYGLPMDESLKPMRIKRNPIQLHEGLVCSDRLESNGVIRIMETTGGGSLYIQADPDGAVQDTNMTMVAEVTVLVDLEEERTVRINRIYHEYGHDELIPVLMGQVLNFADFYNCSLCIPDPKKAEKLQAQGAIRRDNAFPDGRF